MEEPTAASGLRYWLSWDESRCAAPPPVSSSAWSAAIPTTRTPTAQKLAAKAMVIEKTTTEEQISAIQIERSDARQDLRDTLTEVNAKVGRAEGEMRPDHVIESHPVGACLIAGALGFLFGSIANSRGAGPVVIAALLGFAISKHASKDQS